MIEKKGYLYRMYEQVNYQQMRWLYIVKTLGYAKCIESVLSRLLTVNHYYILQLNISYINEFIYPRILAGVLQLLKTDDIATIQNQMHYVSKEDRKELLIRLLFLKNGFKNCYIFKVNEKIACLQWLVYPCENSILNHRYKNRYYLLSPNQVMVENVYTFPEFRGKGLLPFVTTKLLHIASEKGYKSAITYVRKDKIISLNEFAKLGFRIKKMVNDYKLCGIAWRSL